MDKCNGILPLNLVELHSAEEELREKSLAIVSKNQHLRLHLLVVKEAMDIADMLRQYDTDDEDLKVIQILGMRAFNALASSLKLALSGYAQNSALVLRDILETIFLLDLFRGDRTKIENWRLADRKRLKDHFSPVKVRIALDDRDGLTTKKRAAKYQLLSDLAGHANMNSVYMMRPEKDGNAVSGPFVVERVLYAIISEMAITAIQVGEILIDFYPSSWPQGYPSKYAFLLAKQQWINAFYPQSRTGKP